MDSIKVNGSKDLLENWTLCKSGCPNKSIWNEITVDRPNEKSRNDTFEMHIELWPMKWPILRPTFPWPDAKVGSIFPVFIWSEFHMGQYRRPLGRRAWLYLNLASPFSQNNGKSFQIRKRTVCVYLNIRKKIKRLEMYFESVIWTWKRKALSLAYLECPDIELQIIDKY